jgi:tetratricopeptide (TPR) repeat protein
MTPAARQTIAPDSTEFTGTTRYRVRKRLGSGGMGVVYQAHDAERDMDVALKVLLRMDADGIYRLKSEFRSLADVSHPNLVGLFELVSEGNQWFLTMELVEGVDFLVWVRGEEDARVGQPDVHTVGADSQPDHAQTLPDNDDAQVTARPLSDLTNLDTVAAEAVTGDTGDGPAPRQRTDVDATAPDPNETMAFADLEAGQQAPGAAAFVLHNPTVVRAARKAKLPDLERLRAAMRQLAEGVHAIHVGGKLHRDIKPSNAMVAPDGRVVMLDFGLVQEDGSLAHLRNRRESQHDRAISGTPAYMAPEQAMGREVTAASDWYAVGVMLYQALTGDLPYHGNWFQLIDAKQHTVPVPPHLLLADVPRDLSDLTMQLLTANPAQRPSEPAILRALGVKVQHDSGVASVDDFEPEMLGRDAELRVLREQFNALQLHRRPHVVHVKGPAGVGKSAIVDTFLADLRDLSGQDRPLILTGKCHEREAVPYKAFDAVIDALTRHLLRMGNSELNALLPTDIAALGQIFPVLRRVTAIDAAPLKQVELEDRRGLRRRAAVALKLLLGRLAMTQPLVIAIDDVQWGDADSAELLASLVELPHALPALLLLAWRDEEMARNPVLQAIDRLGSNAMSMVISTPLPIGPLAREHAEALAIAMMRTDDAESRRRAEIMAKEAGGSPLFIVELVRFRQSGIVPNASQTDPEVTLDQVLRARIENLPPSARHLLDMVTVAGKPIGQRQVFAAAALGREEPVAIARLRNGHYVRTSGAGDDAQMETFHNRIREASMALIAPDKLVRLHEALLQVLAAPRADGHVDVDALAYHALGAGDDVAALRYCLAAARRAHAVFANHDALRHFDTVLRLLTPRTDAEALTLRMAVKEEAAEAARQAGLYERAKQLLLGRLEHETDAMKQAELHVNLGRVAQERGDTGDAIVQLETALRMYGKTPPANLWELAWQSAGQFLQHLFRSWTPTLATKAGHDPTIQKRADTMFALIRIYYFIDVAKVIWAGVTTINMAPQFRKGGDVSMAYSFYGVLLFGMGRLGLSEKYSTEAVTLARLAGDPVAEATGLMRLGTTMQFGNRLDRGQQLLGEAIEQFKAIGEMWELQTGLMLHATGYFMMGDFHKAAVLYDEMGRYGDELNMVMHRGWHQAWAPFCRYLTGQEDAESCRKALERAIELSASAKDVANTVASLQHMANLAVREGQVERAAGLAVRTHECVSKYLVLVPFLQRARIDAAEAALFALENRAVSVKKRTLRKIVKDGYRTTRIIGLMYPYLRGPSLRIRARLVALDLGEKVAEPLFRKAIAVSEATPNHWETAHVWYDAAKCLPSLRKECKVQARKLFESMGCEAELRQMQREMPD